MGLPANADEAQMFGTSTQSSSARLTGLLEAFGALLHLPNETS